MRLQGELRCQSLIRTIALSQMMDISAIDCSGIETRDPFWDRDLAHATLEHGEGFGLGILARL